MALSEDKPQFDPRLASLVATAGGEMPPPEVDAAILAAARREVSARPLATHGGSSETPAPRAKRNWYVPVSIAAVLVLSVSLVTLVQEEKGDELAQAPGAESTSSTRPPSAAKVPAVAASAPPAVLQAPANPPEARSAHDKSGMRADAGRTQGAEGDLARRRTQDNKGAMPDATSPAPPADSAAASAPAPAAAADSQYSGAAAPPPAMPMAIPKRAEPFPGASEREAKPSAVPSAPPAPTRPAGELPGARMRSEADTTTRDTLQESPPAKAAAAAAPRVAQDAPVQPAQVQPPAARSAARPAPQLGGTTRPDEKPAPVWSGLENQPVEKWLERLTELRRDGRDADAEALLSELRRRFPEHPVSKR